MNLHETCLSRSLNVGVCVFCGIYFFIYSSRCVLVYDLKARDMCTCIHVYIHMYLSHLFTYRYTFQYIRRILDMRYSSFFHYKTTPLCWTWLHHWCSQFRRLHPAGETICQYWNIQVRSTQPTSAIHKEHTFVDGYCSTVHFC